MSPRVCLPLILLVTLTAGLVGLDWGLPFNWHADEKVNTAAAMVERHTADPDYFVNPSLHVYLVWGLTHIAYAAHPRTFVPMALGWHIESTRRGGANRAVTFLAYRLARLLSVAFALLTVWLLWHLGSAAFDPTTGLLAAAFLSVTMGLANLAHFATPETTLLFLVLAALGSFERLATDPTPRRYAIAGLLIGLACSTKYTVWLLGVPLLVAHWVGCRGLTASAKATASPPKLQRRRKTPAYNNPKTPARNKLQIPAYRWLLLLALAGAAAAAGFVIATPYSVLSARRFAEDLWFNWTTGAPEGSLAGQRRSWGVYVLTIGNALGWPLFLAALVGAGIAAVHVGTRRARTAVWVHGVWILSFWGFYGMSPHHALRFIMPVVPSLLLLGAAGIMRVARTTRRWRVAVAAAVGGVLLYSAAYTGMVDRKFLEDPRYAAGRWLNEHVVPNATVGYFASESYLPYFSRPGFRIQYLNVIAQYSVVGQAFTDRINQILADGPDVIVDANFFFDRFLDAPARFPERADLYRSLLSGRNAGSFRPAARFAMHGPWWLDPSPELVAPDVVIFARANVRWR